MHPEITALYGARFGIAGILSEDFIDLYRQPEATLKAVARTPSSALGTSRREVGAAEPLPANWRRARPEIVRRPIGNQS